MHYLLRLFNKENRFNTGIIISVMLGFLLPCSGICADVFDILTNAAITLLFYLYGVKLSRESVIAGMLNWRLQSMVLLFTFAFFPVVVPLLQPLFEPVIGAALYAGLIYVACLPSTVQSSIAFTSIAGGNVPAAVCSASVSSLLGVFITPFLVSLLFAQGGDINAEVGLSTILKICYQILIPFIFGQICRKWLKDWVNSHKQLISLNDQTTIWLVVYTSFSGATISGYWHGMSIELLCGLILVCTCILSLTYAATYFSSKLLGFNREDRITIVFCGSKKSLAVGAPMMLAIFGKLDNNLLLPLMIFHQVQLMTCARLASIWHKQGADSGGY